MARRVTLGVLLVVAAPMVSCGSAPSAGSAPSTTQGSVDAGVGIDLPIGPAEDLGCAPTDLVASFNAVVGAKSVSLSPTPFVSSQGRDYLVLEVADPVELSRNPLPEGWLMGDDVDLTYRTVLVGPYSRHGADATTVEELLASDAPVLMTVDGQIGDTQVRPLLRAAGTLAGDGSITLLGPCGRISQPALDTAAREFGTATNADWLLSAADMESAEAVAIDRAFKNLPRSAP